MFWLAPASPILPCPALALLLAGEGDRHAKIETLVNFKELEKSL